MNKSETQMSRDLDLIPSKDELAVYESMAKYAAESRHFQNLGGIPGIMCIALYAREVGVGPFVAIMGGFSNVMGKITMSAELMGSLIRRAGHKLEIQESTPTCCKIKGTRADTGETYTASFTIEEARMANLVKGGSWEKYPSDMLFARCISRLRRRLFSDIATKSYVEGELEAEEKPRKPESPSVVEIAVEPKQEEEPTEEVIGFREVLDLETLIGEDQDLLQRVLKTYGKKSLTQIEKKDYVKIRSGLESKYGKSLENS